MSVALAIPEAPPAPRPALRQVAPDAVHWRQALELFLDARADSPHTRRAYRRHVENAMDAFGVYAVADLDGAALAGWRAQVTTSTLAPASQSQALAALRSFLRWSRVLGLHRLPEDVVRDPNGIDLPQALLYLKSNDDPAWAEIVRIMHDVVLDVGALATPVHGDRVQVAFQDPYLGARLNIRTSEPALSNS